MASVAQHSAAYPLKAEEPIDLERFLGGVELELIQRAMTQAKGNKTKAAEILQVSYKTLLTKIKDYGIEN